MATRTIVTSQPDVACDVCTRRLLRGEQPDVFLADGRRRLVCELCAPRAIHEGWLRESERAAVSLPTLRPRRGRSLLGRLRQVARPSDAAGEPADAVVPYEPEAGVPVAEPYDFLEDPTAAGTAPVPARAPALPGAPGPAAPELPGAPEPAAPELPGAPEPGAPELPGAPAEDQLRAAAYAQAGADGASSRRAATALDLALEAFNASEHPRRVLGVARSLGAPEVSVRSAEHALSVVVIVVAWELCWYRYKVDVDERPLEVLLVEEGAELGELTHEDRDANALALESGALQLAGA